ncbi:CLUMA_CG010138, isoform A [Clunio marinus]|uniref:CLUMA_CG010138, isoform A n=1 Tax=Clunio marinus TaxID=568069 RepID=A0A1J1I8C4_9DIPT|nr:CLUMA_CG010138, isoform A [Clunio marinus]
MDDQILAIFKSNRVCDMYIRTVSAFEKLPYLSKQSENHEISSIWKIILDKCLHLSNEKMNSCLNVSFSV